MSRISTIMISCPDDMDDAPEPYRAIDAWLSTNGHKPLSHVSQVDHGGCSTYVAIAWADLRNLDENAFAAAVWAQAWPDKHDIVLTIYPDEGYPRIWRGGVELGARN